MTAIVADRRRHAATYVVVIALGLFYAVSLAIFVRTDRSASTVLRVEGQPPVPLVLSQPVLIGYYGCGPCRRSGWSAPEADWTWTIADTATLIFAAPPVPRARCAGARSRHRCRSLRSARHATHAARLGRRRGRGRGAIPPDRSDERRLLLRRALRAFVPRAGAADGGWSYRRDRASHGAGWSPPNVLLVDRTPPDRRRRPQRVVQDSRNERRPCAGPATSPASMRSLEDSRLASSTT